MKKCHLAQVLTPQNGLEARTVCWAIEGPKNDMWQARLSTISVRENRSHHWMCTHGSKNEVSKPRINHDAVGALNAVDGNRYRICKHSCRHRSDSGR